MKKTIVFLTLLALVALPATAMSAKTGDFELGGYVKLHTWFDSTSQVNKNMSSIGPNMGQNGRNNAWPRTATQGRFSMTAVDTRFNFKIKGPDVWGAKTQGYIELDFAPAQDPPGNAVWGVAPRLRHAWFRFDWPGGWQVLMGQYWGVFCNYWPDTVQSGPLFGHGMSTQRLPQIRVTYATGPWTFAALAGAPNDAIDNGFGGLNIFNVVTQEFEAFPGQGAFPGMRSTMPQFGVQATYEKDLWGKAAFFSRPRAFSANVSFAIQRLRYDAGQVGAVATWGNLGYNAYAGVANGVFANDQTVVPWMVQASLFIPVLPTQTQDLKNTASLQLQFYVGQGLASFGNEIGGISQSNSYLEFDAFENVVGGNEAFYRHKLMKRYGGYAQFQYYFNNEWYVSYLYGFAKAYGVNRDRNAALATVANPAGYEFGTLGDPIKFIQEHDISLFYRPNANFKFGLSYAYINQNYFQETAPFFGLSPTTRGDNHRVQFAGWFFF